MKVVQPDKMIVVTQQGDPTFLAGGGAMGERIRSFPWSETALGDPAGWPQSLRTALRILLTTEHPMFLFWGSEHTCFYNDAYARSLGPEKHPSILGGPGRHAWEEIWPSIAPQIEHVMSGKGATWHKDQLLPIVRHGTLEDVYWTYSYSPVDEPQARHGVGGVLVICTETTDYVLAERRLSGERERFVRLFDQAPTFLAVLEGPDHVIKLANPGYLKLVGPRDVVGRPVAQALPEAAAQGFVKILDDVYRTGQPYSAYGARYTTQSTESGTREEVYLDFVYQPMTAADGTMIGILVQGVDVSARAAADRALALSRARLNYATRLSGVGFWYCDLPFDVLQWDERVREHFFFPPVGQVTINDFYARIHEDDRELTRAAIQASVSSRSPYDIVYRTIHPSTGAIKWIRALGGTDYADDGTPTHFDGVTVDVTAQKLDQQTLSILNDQLREQDRLKDQFIAILSHELRNPLAPIRAAAQVVATPDVSRTQLQRAQLIIERQVAHMALLLDDLLDIARITQGKLQVKKQATTLLGVVDAAVEAVRPALDARHQELALKLPPESVTFVADPLRLSQILSNLLTNASKYSDEGSQIRLAVTVEAASMLISVQDDGIGMAPESLDRVFDMFLQVERGAGMSGGGLGIGLALVKGLTELHSGTVQARSGGLGRGSEFIVHLPLVSPALMRPSPAAPDSTHADPVRRKVLVVDDNVDAADSLSMLLQLAGHEVRVAYLGRDALSQGQQFHPDVVLLDIGMPDMSGYEVARRLRQETWARNVQLIALTGWGQDDDRRQAFEAGFDHHLCKPVDSDQLGVLIGSGSLAIP